MNARLKITILEFSGKVYSHGLLTAKQVNVFECAFPGCTADIRDNVGNRQNRDVFDQCVSRRHFLSKRDINNIRARVPHHV